MSADGAATISRCKAGPRRCARPDPAAASGTTLGRLLSLFVVAACAGCGGIQPIRSEENYLTYEHAYTDAAAAATRKSAEEICTKRKQIAIRTQNVCSLSSCFTTYQCTDKAEARESGLLAPGAQ